MQRIKGAGLKKSITSFILPSIFFILILFSYLYSLCPTVYLIDSGELATVSYTLGIAHPTGYPLYTLISYFFTHLPGEPIRNLNLLSAIFSTCASLFLYLCVKRIIHDRFIPFIIVSLFALSPTIWRVSVTNEVYPLTALFSFLLIYLLFELKDIKNYYGLMYFIGLSFTNHIIIFTLAIPLFLYSLFVYKPKLKDVIFGLVFAFLGFSLYFYLIARTLGGAEIAWGDTYNPQRFLWHITGKQYQVWMFSLSMNEILNNARQGLAFILQDFIIIFILPVIVGFYWLFKNNKKFFFLHLFIFLLNFLYTINYAIPDIEPYYIPSVVSLSVVCAYGFKLFQRYIKWFIAIPISFVIFVLNYPKCTLRNNTFARDYALAHISELPPQSLFICSFWDIYSPTIYLKKAENIRRDLVIIDKELLRRSWYIKYLRNTYPEFCNEAKEEIDDYLVELFKFEYGKPYSPYTIQNKFIRMLERFVEIKESIGVYFALPFPDHDLNSTKPEYLRIPYGLVYMIKSDSTSVAFDFLRLKIQKPKFINDSRLDYDIQLVKRMIVNNINYLIAKKNCQGAEKAKVWLREFTQ